MRAPKFNQDFDYVVWDTETEGLSLRYDRPWQFAFLECRLFKERGKGDIWIDLPDFHISKDAARVTKFDKKRYNRKKTPMAEAWEKMEKYFCDDKYWLVGHNILGYDVYMIQNLRREVGLPVDWSFLDRCIDTYALAKGLALEEEVNRSSARDFLMWQYRVLNQRYRGGKLNLSALGKRYEIEHDESKLHDAMADIRLNKKVFEKLAMEVGL